MRRSPTNFHLFFSGTCHCLVSSGRCTSNASSDRFSLNRFDLNEKFPVQHGIAYTYERQRVSAIPSFVKWHVDFYSTDHLTARSTKLTVTLSVELLKHLSTERCRLAPSIFYETSFFFYETSSQSLWLKAKT